MRTRETRHAQMSKSSRTQRAHRDVAHRKRGEDNTRCRPVRSLSGLYQNAQKVKLLVDPYCPKSHREVQHLSSMKPGAIDRPETALAGGGQYLPRSSLDKICKLVLWYWYLTSTKYCILCLGLMADKGTLCARLYGYTST